MGQILLVPFRRDVLRLKLPNGSGVVLDLSSTVNHSGYVLPAVGESSRVSSIQIPRQR